MKHYYLTGVLCGQVTGIGFLGAWLISLWGVLCTTDTSAFFIKPLLKMEQLRCNRCGHLFARAQHNILHVCPFDEIPAAAEPRYLELRKPQNFEAVKAALHRNNAYEKYTICGAANLAIPGIWPLLFYAQKINKTAHQMLESIGHLNPYDFIDSILKDVPTISYPGYVKIFDVAFQTEYRLSPPWTTPGDGYIWHLRDGVVTIEGQVFLRVSKDVFQKDLRFPKLINRSKEEISLKGFMQCAIDRLLIMCGKVQHFNWEILKSMHSF